MTNGVVCSDFAKEIGFENGDKIIAIDGLGVDRFSDINKDMVLRDESYVVDIVRNGSLERVEIGNNFIKHWKNSGKEKLFTPRTLVQVGSLSKGSFSEKAGIKPGDVLMSVNGVSTRFLTSLRGVVEKQSPNSHYWFRQKWDFIEFVLMFLAGKIGFSLDNNLDLSIEEFGFLESFPMGSFIHD